MYAAMMYDALKAYSGTEGGGDMREEYAVDQINPMSDPGAKNLKAKEKGIRVTDAVPMCGGKMLVSFSTGEKRLFDTKLLQGSAFEQLSDEKIFMHPVVFHGVITWNNGKIDVAPETVYQLSTSY